MVEKMQKLVSGEVVKFEKSGDSISGTFISYEESKTYPGSYAVKIKNPADERPKTVFVSGIVIDLIKTNNIQPGQSIMIEFKGKVKTKDGKKEYNNYDVYA